MRKSALAAILILLVGCSPATDRPTTFGDDQPRPPKRAGGSGRDDPRGSPAPVDEPEPVGSSPTPAGDPVTYPERAGVGAMARIFLRPEPARRLVVEIDFVRGRRPSEAAITHLRSILERETDKPGGVEVGLDDEMPEGDGSRSLADVLRLERRFRDGHGRGATTVLWIGVLDGRSEEDGSALGVAYRASSVVIFRDRIAQASTLLVPTSSIERSVLVHELGHLLGLVHIGYDHVHDHEDAEHPGHSRFRISVMYWAIEDISIASILEGGPPDDFDEPDKNDLALLRAGGL